MDALLVEGIDCVEGDADSGCLKLTGPSTPLTSSGCETHRIALVSDFAGPCSGES